MTTRPRVLFLCTGNSCRSQMAEGWLRALAGERYEALSAGVHPGGLDPEAVAVMAEVGVDISGQSSDDIRDFVLEPPQLVVSVCDSARESCPIFPAPVESLHWSFEDPKGGGLALFRRVRDEIRAQLEVWLSASSTAATAER